MNPNSCLSMIYLPMKLNIRPLKQTQVISRKVFVWHHPLEQHQNHCKHALEWIRRTFNLADNTMVCSTVLCSKNKSPSTFHICTWWNPIACFHSPNSTWVTFGSVYYDNFTVFCFTDVLLGKNVITVKLEDNNNINKKILITWKHNLLNAKSLLSQIR